MKKSKFYLSEAFICFFISVFLYMSMKDFSIIGSVAIGLNFMFSVYFIWKYFVVRNKRDENLVINTKELLKSIPIALELSDKYPDYLEGYETEDEEIEASLRLLVLCAFYPKEEVEKIINQH